VDARGTPSWILRDHLKDQFADLFGNSSAADSLSYLAEHGPIRLESDPMPPSNSFWQDQNKHLPPSRPEAARQHPKQLIEWPQPGPGMFAFEHGELLAKGEVLEHQAAVSAKNAKNGSEAEPKEVEHGGRVIADRILISLISKADGIMTRHTAQTFYHPLVEIFNTAITRSYQGAMAKSWTGSSPATTLDSRWVPCSAEETACYVIAIKYSSL
jgi:hypothetical protein